MVDNIEKVLERGEKIELLVDKTDNLRFQVCSADIMSGSDLCQGTLRPCCPSQAPLLVLHC